MVKSHALPDTESATCSPIYRHPNAKDQLTHTPLDGIATLYDLITKRGFSAKPGNEILGERKLVRMIEEEKEVTKKVPGGGEVKEVKTWKYYQLSGYDWMTWGQVEALSTAYASGYRALGLNPGDRLTIYADTSRDWLVTAIACIQQSITVTTAYATLGEDGLSYSLQECEISTVFTNAELLPMLTKVAHVVKYLKNIVYNGEADVKTLAKLKEEHPRLKVLSLVELRTLGEANVYAPVPPSKQDLAVIMYTSGSTGPPKGVMLTHANVVATVGGYYHHFKGDFNADGVGETYLSFLPLSHILEFSVEFLMLFYSIPIGYGSPKTLVDTNVRNCKGDLRELRPTLLAGVPAVWDAIRKGVDAKVNSASSISRAVFKGAFGLKSALMSAGLDSLAAPLDAFVFKAVKDQVGGRLKMGLSAGAPIPKSTHEFLNVTAARVVNAYGMTESTAGLIIQEVQDASNLGVVGAPLMSGEVKLVDVENTNYKASNLPKPQGEIWLRGPTIMKGYFKQEELTRETITPDGWLRTGDIAERNLDGTFTIIDRTKNLVKLSNGEYIAIEKLESNYKVSKFVQSICIHAESLESYAVAVVQPVEREIRATAVSLNLYPGVEASALDFDELCARPEIRGVVLDSLKAVAKSVGFKSSEILGQVCLTTLEWTPQNGLLTAAMKLQRKAILSHYKKEIADMYKK